MNRLILFILPLLISCDREVIVRPQPDYLLERFEPGKACPEIGYINIHFPDSSLYLNDTISNAVAISIGNGIDEFGFGYQLYDANGTKKWTFTISLLNSSLICNFLEFVDYGSYRYFAHSEQPSGALVRVKKHPENLSYRSTLDSKYFYVYNKRGPHVTFCGEFNAIVYNPQRDETVPITGEFSGTYWDIYFSNCP